MRARGLIANTQIQFAHLIEAQRTRRVRNIVQRGVLPDPRVGAAARVETHRVGCHQRQLAIGGLDDVLTVGHVDLLILGGDAAAHGGVVAGGIAGGQVVPGIVGDVVGAAG